ATVTGVQTCALPIYPKILDSGQGLRSHSRQIRCQCQVVGKCVDRGWILDFRSAAQSRANHRIRWCGRIVVGKPHIGLYEAGISRSEERRVGEEREMM